MHKWGTGAGRVRGGSQRSRAAGGQGAGARGQTHLASVGDERPAVVAGGPAQPRRDQPEVDHAGARLGGAARAQPTERKEGVPLAGLLALADREPRRRVVIETTRRGQTHALVPVRIGEDRANGRLLHLARRRARLPLLVGRPRRGSGGRGARPSALLGLLRVRHGGARARAERGPAAMVARPLRMGPRTRRSAAVSACFPSANQPDLATGAAQCVSTSGVRRSLAGSAGGLPWPWGTLRAAGRARLDDHGAASDSRRRQRRSH